MCCHRSRFALLTMTSSCSFRITRTAEDLANTISALSQRLIKLEQRQEALELQLDQISSEPSEQEVKMLDGVEDLLKECQELLETSCEVNSSEDKWMNETDNDLAA